MFSSVAMSGVYYDYKVLSVHYNTETAGVCLGSYVYLSTMPIAIWINMVNIATFRKLNHVGDMFTHI